MRLERRQLVFGSAKCGKSIGATPAGHQRGQDLDSGEGRGHWGIPAFFTATGVGTIVAEGKPVSTFDGRDYLME